MDGRVTRRTGTRKRVPDGARSGVIHRQGCFTRTAPDGLRAGSFFAARTPGGLFAAAGPARAAAFMNQAG